MEKKMVPGLGQVKYKMSLEFPVVPERKEVLGKGWRRVKSTQESTRRSSQWPKLDDLSNKIMTA